VEAFALSVGSEFAGVLPVGKKGQRACCAFGNTGRFFPAINSLDTKAALPHGLLRRAELRHMKGTGLNAIAATNASAPDVLHDSIFSSLQSSRRAGRNTGWIIAMKACSRNEQRTARGERARHMGFHPPKLHARRCVIFKLTGHFAGMATNTFLCVKNNQRFHSIKP
jgi:hypothetical protein